MKFNDLSIGNFFTTYEQGKMLVGVKINAENAINMATGDKLAMHFNRRVDAGKVTSLDLDKTTLARRQGEIVFASPTENGRWLVHSFLITSTELCNKFSNPGKGRTPDLRAFLPFFDAWKRRGHDTSIMFKRRRTIKQRTFRRHGENIASGMRQPCGDRAKLLRQVLFKVILKST